MYDILDKLSENKVTVIFFASTSRFYKEVVCNAKKFSDYKEIIENDLLKHIITVKKTKNNNPEQYKKEFLLLGRLVDSYIADWKGFQIFYNDKEGTKKKLVETYNCYRDSLDEEITKNYCTKKDNCPFCCYKCGIFTSSDIYSECFDDFEMFEYEHNITPYGVFDKLGNFNIDKEILVNDLIQKLSRFSLCPNLDIEELKDSINDFPLSINPNRDKEWGYDIDDNNKVIGIIKNKKSRHIISHSFSIEEIEDINRIFGDKNDR